MMARLMLNLIQVNADSAADSGTHDPGQDFSLSRDVNRVELDTFWTNDTELPTDFAGPSHSDSV